MSSDSKLDGREALLQALRQVHPGLVRLTAAHSRQIINLIAARGREGGEGREDREDRYAALLSRCRTSAARILIEQVFGEVAAWQRRSGKRVRKFRAKSGQTYHVAIERFVGDLLRARGDNKSSGHIYHATGATTFDDVPVNYDVFMGDA
jgi:hypothetical protein